MLRVYENIRLLRKSKGWTQEELAEKVGYTSKGMISTVENGKIDLPISKIMQFADVFGVDAGDLVGEPVPMQTGLILDLFESMNLEGQTKLVELAEMMVDSGRYKKTYDADEQLWELG